MELTKVHPEIDDISDIDKVRMEVRQLLALRTEEIKHIYFHLIATSFFFEQQTDWTFLDGGKISCEGTIYNRFTPRTQNARKFGALLGSLIDKKHPLSFVVGETGREREAE